MQECTFPDVSGRTCCVAAVVDAVAVSVVTAERRQTGPGCSKHR